ncbi:hypothetical protein J2TS4_36640 [Paenibacillus sp. J2TS4]|nr:hypothetical protein J2TS4_36640 [Paenibacillus sp. J2TS4]
MGYRSFNNLLGQGSWKENSFSFIVADAFAINTESFDSYDNRIAYANGFSAAGDGLVFFSRTAMGTGCFSGAGVRM